VVIVQTWASTFSRSAAAEATAIHTCESRHREKYEKDIYWQNSPENPEKWLQTSEKKVR